VLEIVDLRQKEQVEREQGPDEELTVGYRHEKAIPGASHFRDPVAMGIAGSKSFVEQDLPPRPQGEALDQSEDKGSPCPQTNPREDDAAPMDLKESDQIVHPRTL
jgi:hypothetical protein